MTLKIQKLRFLECVVALFKRRHIYKILIGKMLNRAYVVIVNNNFRSYLELDYINACIFLKEKSMCNQARLEFGPHCVVLVIALIFFYYLMKRTWVK